MLFALLAAAAAVYQGAVGLSQVRSVGANIVALASGSQFAPGLSSAAWVGVSDSAFDEGAQAGVANGRVYVETENRGVFHYFDQGAATIGRVYKLRIWERRRRWFVSIDGREILSWRGVSPLFWGQAQVETEGQPHYSYRLTKIEIGRSISWEADTRHGKDWFVARA